MSSEPDTEPTTRRTASHLGAGLSLAAAAMLALAAAGFGIAVGWDWSRFVETYTLTNTVDGLGLALSGGLIAWYRPRNAVGTVLLIAGLGHLVSAAAAPLGMVGVEAGWPELITRLLATLFLVGWTLGLASLFLLALVLFPDGRLPSARWQWLAGAIIGFAAWGAVTSALAPAELIPGEPASRSLFAAPTLPFASLDLFTTALSALLLPPVVATLVLRYRRGDERVRRQLLWLILAVIAMLALNAQRWLTGDGPILLLLSFVLVPVAIAIAVIRYQLLDIRIVLSRAVVYGILAVLVIALYAAIVAGLLLLVPAQWDRGVATVAALAVAFAFVPLHRLLQRAILRAFYGFRDDPVRTVERVGAGLGGAGDLHDVLAAARSALRVPRLAVTAHPHGLELAAVGEATPDPVYESVPLSAGGKAVGSLVVTLRIGERRLHDADRRSLALVAPPLALLLRERELAEALRDARAQTVEARERERSTLHRDLHDGLGPTLTGAALRADAAANLLSDDPEHARELLAATRAAIRDALAEVRRVVYGLRPIPLDELGLLGAVKEHALRCDGLHVEVDAPARLPALSPAIELAAYRIVIEAITNAQRHSAGTAVHVVLDADSAELRVRVADDGLAPGAFTPGAGIRSILQRAEELGGTADVGPTADGWRTEAVLPLRGSD